MPGAAADRSGALLERAYRLALLLDEACRAARDDAAFDRAVLSAELLALLDDARAARLADEAGVAQSRSAPAYPVISR